MRLLLVGGCSVAGARSTMPCELLDPEIASRWPPASGRPRRGGIYTFGYDAGSDEKWVTRSPYSSSLGKSLPRAQTQHCEKHAEARTCQWVRKAERQELRKDMNKILCAHSESGARNTFYKLKRWAINLSIPNLSRAVSSAQNTLGKSNANPSVKV